MNDTCKLGELPLHQTAVVAALSPENALTPRLKQLGIVSGVHITPLFKSVLGDPVAYRVKDCVLALRRKECDSVTVRVTEENSHAV